MTRATHYINLLLLSALTLNQTHAAGDMVVDPDTHITLPEGFDAEILYDVPTAQGSWVAMAFDPKGRLIVSDQDSKGIFRVTLPAEGGTARPPRRWSR